MASSCLIETKWVFVLIADEDLGHSTRDGRNAVAGADRAWLLVAEKRNHGLLGALVEEHLVEDDAVTAIGKMLEFVEVFDLHGAFKLEDGPIGLAGARGSTEDEGLLAVPLEDLEVGGIGIIVDAIGFALAVECFDLLDFGSALGVDAQFQAGVLDGGCLLGYGPDVLVHLPLGDTFLV